MDSMPYLQDWKLRRQARGRQGKRYTVQRTVKRYDDDGDGKDVGLRLMLLAAVTMAARALPPLTNRRRMTKKESRGKTTRN